MRFFLLSLLLTVCAGLQAARIDSVRISSPYLDEPNPVIIITPDAAAEDVSARFPTVYLLNGYSGDHRGWLYTLRPDLPKLADQYGMVIVMPHGRDSWYWDSPELPGMQMESFFTKELVPYIDANYPTVQSAEKRAISGLSMGGHGAMWLAMRHSDIWGNVGSMSGGVDIRPFPDSWKMKQRLGSKADHPERWEQHTVANLVPTLKPGQLNITFDCGTDDFFYPVNCALHESLAKAGIPHDFTSRPGAHTRQYWSNSILYHLLFFNEAFNKSK